MQQSYGSPINLSYLKKQNEELMTKWKVSNKYVYNTFSKIWAWIQPLNRYRDLNLKPHKDFNPKIPLMF